VEVLPEESLRLKTGPLSLNYGTHKTGITDKDASLSSQLHTFKKNGAILHYSPLPVEANDQRESVAGFYGTLAALSKIKPYCEMKGAPGFQVTVLPRRFPKTALYIALNESSQDHTVQLRDNRFGFKVSLKVPAGRVALAVFDAKGKNLVSYSNPDF
jgi:hypothetical protein